MTPAEGLLAIDVGTTRTRVAYTSPDGAERQLVRVPSTHLAWFPTAVARSPHGGWLVGEPAESRRVVRPDMYWGDVKRHLGEEAPHHLGGHPFTVVEALAQLLGHAARLARRQAGHGFERLALGAPVVFETGRVDALHEAAELAGFAPEDVTVTSEPKAAARAALGPRPDDGLWVVFDLGGGTIDAALLRAAGGGIDLLDVAGDDTLSGDAIDAAIAGWLRERYDLAADPDDPGAVRRAIYLDDAARTLKHDLTDQRDTAVFLPEPPTELTMSRADLTALVRAGREACARALREPAHRQRPGRGR